jgi:glutamate synthase domain-containing protein 3
VEFARAADLGQAELLRHLVEQHARYTDSARAKRELGRWERAEKLFVAVVPTEYRKALERQAEADAANAIPAARRRLVIGEARHG